MRFKANREKLLEALALPVAAIPEHCSKPAMMLLKIMAAVPGRVDFAGTDPGVAVIQTFTDGVEVRAGGDVLVQPGKLFALLKVMTDETVELAAGVSGTELTGAASRFVLPGDLPEHFPKLEVLGETPDYYFETSSGPMRELLRKTLFCMPKKDATARWSITAAQWSHAEGKLTVAATDTKRLSVASVAAAKFGTHPEAEGNGKVLVPREAMVLLDRACRDGDGAPVRVVFESSHVWFQVGALTIRTRQMSGSFPPWQSIVPKAKQKLTIPLDRVGFLGAVRAAGKFTDDETKRVSLTFKPGSLTVEAKDGVNDASGEITHKAAGCTSSLELAFNPQYLSEFLGSVDDSEVRLLADDGEKPVLFRPTEDYLHLIMPLSI